MQSFCRYIASNLFGSGGAPVHKRIWQVAQHYCSARCELARGEGTPVARTGNAGLAAHAALAASQANRRGGRLAGHRGGAPAEAARHHTIHNTTPPDHLHIPNLPGRRDAALTAYVTRPQHA